MHNGNGSMNTSACNLKLLALANLSRRLTIVLLNLNNLNQTLTQQIRATTQATSQDPDFPHLASQ